MNSIWAESKLFHDVVPLATTALYSPKLSKNGQAKIWNFIIANNAAAGVNVTVWAGDTAVANTIIVPGCLVGPHELWVPPIVCYLGYGESIWGLASAAGVTLCLNGGVRQ
jgi:hypothetical protein